MQAIEFNARIHDGVIEVSTQVIDEVCMSRQPLSMIDGLVRHSPNWQIRISPEGR